MRAVPQRTPAPLRRLLADRGRRGQPRAADLIRRRDRGVTQRQVSIGMNQLAAQRRSICFPADREDAVFEVVNCLRLIDPDFYYECIRHDLD